MAVAMIVAMVEAMLTRLPGRHLTNNKVDDCNSFDFCTGVSILISYGVKPLYVKLPIFSEFMENSTKFMKNSGLTKWTQNLR